MPKHPPEPRGDAAPLVVVDDGLRPIVDAGLAQLARELALTGRVACNYGLDKERALLHPPFGAPGATHLLSMGDAVADIPLLDNSLIPIVAGGQSLRLKEGTEPIRFSDSPWDLGRLEERLARLDLDGLPR